MILMNSYLQGRTIIPLNIPHRLLSETGHHIKKQKIILIGTQLKVVPVKYAIQLAILV